MDVIKDKLFFLFGKQKGKPHKRCTVDVMRMMTTTTGSGWVHICMYTVEVSLQ